MLNFNFHSQIHFDQENNHVCQKCWRITVDFHDLYEIVQAADEKLTALHPAIKDDESVWPVVDQTVAAHIVKEEPIDDIIVEPNVSEIEEIDPKDEILEETTVQKRRLGRPPKSSTPTVISPKTAKANESIIDHRQSDLQDQQIREFFEMTCEICKLSFHTMRQAIQHYRKSHNQAGYLVCCEKKFFRRCLAVDHIRLHINPNSLQ